MSVGGGGEQRERLFSSTELMGRETSAPHFDGHGLREGLHLEDIGFSLEEQGREGGGAQRGMLREARSQRDWGGRRRRLLATQASHGRTHPSCYVL